MFDITPTKIFKDSVHGYINIPVCFVDNIIDTDAFQRLRNIDQTGMRVLYPNAKHDRFGHSLGVFYLGSKAVDSLLLNFASNTYWKISSDNKRALFWAKNKLLFLLACLLHDIGHTPFSHSLENMVLENSREGGDTFTQLLINKINQSEEMGEKITDLGKAAAHEKIGAMMILDLFRENIERIYDYLNKNRFPQEEDSHILYAEHYRNDVVIDSSQIDNDICFIVRMILGLKYQGYEPEKQIRNCFIELLNGENIDVDKLDYIVRDTKMSGISNIDIDLERLLGSVCIILKTRFIDKEFDSRDFSNRTFHILDNWRNEKNTTHLKGNFSGTLVLGQDSKVRIASGSTFVSLTGSREDSQIKYEGDPVKFDTQTIVYQDGVRIFNEREGMFPLPETKNSEPFKINVQNATLGAEKDFCFSVCGQGNMKLSVNGNCDVAIVGNCKAEGEVNFYEESFVSGVIHEMEIMGNEIREALPVSQMYNTFSVGFRKQALSIVSNVLEARNYLYLWIYAHHKVIYYANFLIPVISSSLLSPHKKYRNFPYWNLNYKDIVHLDDSYVWTVIKTYDKLNCEETIKRLCKEILCRKFKKSLFKSLAEYDLLFEPFTDEQKKKLKSNLSDAVDKTRLCVIEDSIVTAGFIGKDIIDELKRREGMKHIEEIIYVDAGYSNKVLNTHETFIDLHGEAISVDKILLLNSKRDYIDKSSSPYFYLYYSSEAKSVEEKRTENAAIKAAIKEYFIL